MAEIHFFMTHRDTHDFVSFLADFFQTTFTLDQHVTAELPVVDTVEDVDYAVRYHRDAPRFFVMSPRWQRYPLPGSETHHLDGRRLFYVDQRYGGPAFHLIVSRQAGSPDCIYPGSFSDYPWYYVRRGQPQTFDRPEEMATVYREVQRYLRRHGKRSRRRGKDCPGPFILPDALACYQQGSWLRQGNWHFEAQ